MPERHYTAPCPRPDGCRVRSLTGSPGNQHGPTIMLADCGWTTEVPQGGEHHLTAALQRWREHECVPAEAAGHYPPTDGAA